MFLLFFILEFSVSYLQNIFYIFPICSSRIFLRKFYKYFSAFFLFISDIQISFHILPVLQYMFDKFSRLSETSSTASLYQFFHTDTKDLCYFIDCLCRAFSIRVFPVQISLIVVYETPETLESRYFDIFSSLKSSFIVILRSLLYSILYRYTVIFSNVSISEFCLHQPTG